VSRLIAGRIGDAVKKAQTIRVSPPCVASDSKELFHPRAMRKGF
jgi:hypothetical protein